ncbi:terpene synthase family protein [Streptomyces sp. enrichment culture]|uniref:terpene synthase family protein n=1 Tax=Streptomyces sp. enrichment culture TaxID=1795815 RepID=UPI003F55D46D
MPSNVEFHIPFPSAVSPDAAAADEHLVRWALAQKLLAPEQARYFAAMRLGTCAAYVYPHARSEDLDLAADHMGLCSLVNDLCDSTDGVRAEEAADVCHDLLALFEQDAPSRPATPVGAAWCGLWQRLRDGMPQAWRKRVLHEHTTVFSAYLDHRIRRTMPTADQYLQRRYITTGLSLGLAVAERVEHWRAPEWFLETPLARRLLQEATKLAILPNDVFAVEREERRGEVDNMVLVLEAAGRTRDEAIADIQAMVRLAGDRFRRLADRLPDHYDDLGCSPADRTAADTYVQAMRHMFRGNYDWMTDGSARYDRHATSLAVSSGYEDAPGTTVT